MRNYFLGLCCTLFSCLPIFGQTDYQVYLLNETLTAADAMLPMQLPASELQSFHYRAHYYVILQFSGIPSALERQQIRRAGVELLSYVSGFSYLAKVADQANLTQLPIRALYPLSAKNKLDPELYRGAYATHAVEANTLHLQLLPMPGITIEELGAALTRAGYSITTKNEQLTTQVPISTLLELAAHPAIRYLETITAEPQPEGNLSRTQMRINCVSNGPGQGLDGSGVAMAIGDDGGINHEDFRGRLYQHTAMDAGTHGDMTAGLAIGAGNLDPRATGAAPGAELHLFDIADYPHLNAAAENYQAYGIVVTSTSFWEGCGGYYSYTAQQLDQEAAVTPKVLHFFSAGNSGQYSCNGNYGDLTDEHGSFFGTITGGRKAAKHTIAVASLFSNDSIHPSSSRGPARDGRIKPDLSALGQHTWSTGPDHTYRLGSGTSAAAPTVAGAATLLYQAYRDRHSGQDPDAALIKAVLLNTADDLGNTGPDFAYGWGRPNLHRALHTIATSQHTTGEVAHASTQTHHLSIPNGVAQAKIMLYWPDLAGDPLAAKALVNDLDIRLLSATGEVYLPYVLQTESNAGLLRQAATQGTDRHNNMEQIVINVPAAGEYILEVKGHLLPFGAQSYYLTYTFLEDELVLMYPNGGEGLSANQTEVIRWDAFGKAGHFTLAYSTDSLASWQTIATQIPGHRRAFTWTVPNTVSGRCFIKVERGEQVAVSQMAFGVCPAVTWEASYQDGQTARINWEAIPGVVGYEVYSLGDQYMEWIGTTEDHFYELTTAPGAQQWLAVRPLLPDGTTGQRSTAQLYVHPMEDQQQIPLSVSLLHRVDPSCPDASDGYLEVAANGGVGEVAYRWSSGAQTALVQQLTAGYYMVTVSDQASSVIVSVSLADPSPLQAETDQRAVSCYGMADGVASIQPVGGTAPYTVSWENQETSTEIDGLTAGVYNYTLTDAQGCTFSDAVVVEQPEILSISLSSSVSPTAGGQITAFVGGGLSPYHYQWSTGATGSSIQSLQHGTYRVTVTDQNGCTISQSATLEDANDEMLDWDPIQASRWQKEATPLVLFPNPATQKTQVFYASAEQGFVDLYIYDDAGRVQHQQQQHATVGENYFAIPLDQLLPGNYWVSLKKGGKTESVKLMVR